MLALNTYSFQTIKLKLAAFLPSAAPTVQFFYICSIASHRTWLLSLSMNLQQLKKLCTFVRLQATEHGCYESATAQELCRWIGSVAKRETVSTFLELRIQKKSEKRPQKWARNSDPFLVPLSIGIFPESSENGLGPAFWCWQTTFKLILRIAQSGRGATISSATCSRRTPKCKAS